ncbi:hypothetical protein [Mucilaginibacter aquatilis]|uniref:hypothetical protein n=1 Tax=Mucilaginibacter aquatilis TaxID=1517760 RepID=UPI001E31C9E5|nr:hypothetical protein [Mucilaginibacter aquatilis]
MKIIFIVALYLSCCSYFVHAQSQPVAPVAPANKISFQLQAGTQGIGGDLRYGLTSRISLRGGASFIPVKANNIFTFSGFDSNNSLSVKFSNVHLWADVVPFKKLQGLRLITGAGYLFKANGNINVLPTGTYSVGNYKLTPADLGSLNIDMSWRGVAPYLGLGLFKGFPKNRFNVNLDLGTYYLSSPKSKVTGTEMLADNYKLEPQLNANMKGYRWLPVAQLNFNFRLR